ncbi:TPA_asm: hypothetical protein PROPHIFVLQ01-1_94 [Mycobacterium phage prophiFVLQ01-1]|nr:TPA_asm: hypothetical protein PROPHIFVLQ01-1_94 [Mycobacterium phage prophiFVLQ01-1]
MISVAVVVDKSTNVDSLKLLYKATLRQTLDIDLVQFG